MSEERYYSSADFNNVGQLFKILAGLGIVSLGAGAAYSGIKNYQNRFMEASAPDYLRPSKLVRNRFKDKKITVDDTYLPDNTKVAQYIGYKMKNAFIDKKADFSDILGAAAKGAFEAATTSKAPKEDKPETTWYDWFAGRRPISAIEQVRLKNKGIGFYPLSELNPSNSTALYRLKANLASVPAMRAAWFLPAAAAAVLGGSYLGYHGVNYINNLLGKRTKPNMDYSEKARQIYNESAQYLKDTVTGKNSDSSLKKKKSSLKGVKDASFDKQAKAIMASDGTSSFWGLSALIGIPAALWVARQMRAFGSGVDSAKEELADRTHMIRAWQAAAKERQYDYNNFDAVLATEPLRDSAAKRIQKKENDFLRNNDADDDNNNQLRYENYVFNKIRSDRDALT